MKTKSNSFRPERWNRKIILGSQYSVDNPMRICSGKLFSFFAEPVLLKAFSVYGLQHILFFYGPEWTASFLLFLWDEILNKWEICFVSISLGAGSQNFFYFSRFQFHLNRNLTFNIFQKWTCLIDFLLVYQFRYGSFTLKEIIGPFHPFYKLRLVHVRYIICTMSNVLIWGLKKWYEFHILMTLK